MGPPPLSALPFFDETFPIGNPIAIIQTADICPLHVICPSPPFLPSFAETKFQDSREKKGERGSGGRGNISARADSLALAVFCGGWTDASDVGDGGACHLNPLPPPSLFPKKHSRTSDRKSERGDRNRAGTGFDCGTEIEGVSRRRRRMVGDEKWMIEWVGSMGNSEIWNH